MEQLCANENTSSLERSSGRPSFSAMPWQHPSQQRLGREWECRPGVAKSVRQGTVELQGAIKKIRGE